MSYSRPNGLETGGMPYAGGNPIVPGTADLILPAHNVLLQDLIIKGDADLTAENIRKGKDLFGVIGTLEEGAKIETGEFTLTSSNVWVGSVTIAHGLKVIPEKVFLIAKSGYLSQDTSSAIDYCVALLWDNGTIIAPRCTYGYYTAYVYGGNSLGVNAEVTADTAKFTISAGSAGFAPDIAYQWFAIV